MTANRYRVSFEGDENVLELYSAQSCEYTKNLMSLQKGELWYVNYISNFFKGIRITTSNI